MQFEWVCVVVTAPPRFSFTWFVCACSLRVPSCVQRAYTKPGTWNPRWWCPFRGQHSVVGRVVVARRHTWSVATVVPCFRRANLLDQCFPTIFRIVSQLNAFKILMLHEHQVLESCYINRYVLRVKSSTRNSIIVIYEHEQKIVGEYLDYLKATLTRSTLFTCKIISNKQNDGFTLRNKLSSDKFRDSPVTSGKTRRCTIYQRSFVNNEMKKQRNEASRSPTFCITLPRTLLKLPTITTGYTALEIRESFSKIEFPSTGSYGNNTQKITT